MTADSYNIFPVGFVRKKGQTAAIEIQKNFKAALLGLDQFSHIHVLYWFHENDTPERRRILQVHPKKDKSNPVTGVFATHSPVRPNLIALALCRIVSITDTIIEVDRIDAVDGTPVIDIKCYIPDTETGISIRVPDWV